MSKKQAFLIALVVFAILGLVSTGWAENVIPNISLPGISINGEKMSERAQVSNFMQVGFALTTLTLAPYILIMTTAFIRVTITMSFLKQAMGTQQVPPTQVLMGMCLFITMFIMAPVGEKMNQQAIQPYFKGEIQQAEFAQKLWSPLRQFMLAQTRGSDLDFFARLSKTSAVMQSRNDAPFYVLCPSYVLSEVKTSFEIGFLLYIPFLVIDMIVSSVLMAMGMFMLSPMTISLPFKLLLFVQIDGWHLVIRGLVNSFNMPK